MSASVLRLVHDGTQSPSFNMAVDEALLIHATDPVLRIYSWGQKCVSIGYFTQKNLVPRGKVFVRRSSGGGIVPHGEDFTFALIFPVSHAFARESAAGAYRVVHECLRDALEAAGIASVLADCCLKRGTGECFVGYEKFDLLSGGTKIAGGAQKRTSKGFLHQGSVHFSGSRPILEQALAEQIAQRFHLTIQPSHLTEQEKATARELDQSRYSSPEWNEKF